MANNNLSEEDYLDSLLKAVSSPKEDEFDIEKELGLTEDFDADFEEEFQKELEAEFAMDKDEQVTHSIDITEAIQNMELPTNNSIFNSEDNSEDYSDEKAADEKAADEKAADEKAADEKGTDKEAADKKAIDIDEFAGQEDIYNIGNTSFTEENTKGKDKADSINHGYSLDEISSLMKSEAEAQSVDALFGEAAVETAPMENVADNIDLFANELESIVNPEGKPTKEELKAKLKAEKARIKANKKAAKEAAKLAKLAEKAEKAKAKAQPAVNENIPRGTATDNSDMNFTQALGDIFDNEPAPYKDKGMTAEEMSINNSVEEELAGLGLDDLFGSIGQETPNNMEAPGIIENLFDDEDNNDRPEIGSLDDIDDLEEKDKGKKKKGKKEKKKKEPKPKKPKKQKVPKVPKEDEIIKVPKGFLIVGISIAALLVAGVYLGGKNVYYQDKLEKAVYYYVNKDYKSAYKELGGLEMKPADEFFYEQVRIVMTVESNYDMFKSQMRLGNYSAGLDALLKGVKSFDIYQNQAREWEAFDDFEIALRRVVNALNKYYNITESKAREINLVESQREYSLIVSELAQKVIYDKDIPFDDETTISEPETTESETTVE